MSFGKNRERTPQIEVDLAMAFLDEKVDYSCCFLYVRSNELRDEMRNGVTVRLNVPNIFAAKLSPLNPNEGGVIGIDTTEGGGMGIAIGGFGAALQRSEVNGECFHRFYLKHKHGYPHNAVVAN